MSETHKIEGTITQTTVDETVEALANADSVILVKRSLILLASPKAHFSLGCWLWNGCCQSPIRHIRDYIHVEG